MVIASVATMLLVMTFKLPNGFLAVFYALAISREDPRSTVWNGFGIVLANLAGVALSFAGVILFIDYPLAHFLFVVASLFLAFFVTRTLVNYSVAFGFSIIVVAAASLIWVRANPAEARVETTIGTAFGIMLGTLVTVLTEWIFAYPAIAADVREKARHGEARHAARLFVPDAFSNPEYLKFALKGCLAGAICYVVWSGLGWPGIGVCTVTCIIAAPLSTPGSSRQRLITRLAGLLAGGVICGLGSQVFILPSVDSVVGFTLPFAAVSGAAAWVATASPRLSYFGRQMALAYYLTMFQGFGINTSLAMSRDRLMGILLGLLVMWLVFDAAGHQEIFSGTGASVATVTEASSGTKYCKSGGSHCTD